MQQQLLAKISALHLPANFLDVLIDELGGPKAVAEMTGRKGRVVRHVSAGGRQQVVYELRAKPDSSEMDSLNGRHPPHASHLTLLSVLTRVMHPMFAMPCLIDGDAILGGGGKWILSSLRGTFHTR
jgi:hypothetical protein